ncbi:hypothetical protein [Paenibacillus sp. YSY-4.3]
MHSVHIVIALSDGEVVVDCTSKLLANNDQAPDEQRTNIEQAS